MKQIDERLRGHYTQLTPQEQRVADFIFAHFDDLISYNSAELARLSGVSKATVSRLFNALATAVIEKCAKRCGPCAKVVCH